MPTIFIWIFIIHWMISLFSQTFFMHRYSAHSMFTMSRGWEKFFFVFSWLTQGSSYLSPYAYGIMHRMHHAYADTEKDPHSPKYNGNIFRMMWKTKVIYSDILHNRIPVEEKFKKNVPQWHEFDEFASSTFSKIAWVSFYGCIYAGIIEFNHVEPWAYFFLVPMFLCHCLMSPVHGAIVNYFAHKYGYTNFETEDTSKNMLFPISIYMMGEGYHNNHHKFSNRPNFGVKWHKLEFDPVWPIIWALDKIRVIRLRSA